MQGSLMSRRKLGSMRRDDGGAPGPAADLSVQRTPDDGRGTATNATHAAVALQVAMQTETSAAVTMPRSQCEQSMSQCAYVM